jgi:phospho-N-acetylmuramoyl-pentapeptide-transferase
MFRLAIIFSTSFLLAYFGIKFFIKKVHKKKILYQPIRAVGPQSHVVSKKNTPTMGGIFIILAAIIASLLFSNIKNNYILIIIFVAASFSAIGFVDDYIKITKKNSNGFRGGVKLVIQFTIVALVMLFLKMTNSIYFNGEVVIPFTNLAFDLGEFYIFFATFVVVGTANAVNLTDGLDGLVSIPAIVALVCFTLIIYATSNPSVSSNLGILNINNTAQLIMFCAALIGAILAFLKFNLMPAKIFMGDVGSLAIGASLGVLAIILKKELLFGIIALLFVIEAMSVILQVASYKMFKKRIFLMSPIHHHFEKLGWSETKVVLIFWLASLIFAAIGMASFLIR